MKENHSNNSITNALKRTVFCRKGLLTTNRLFRRFNFPFVCAKIVFNQVSHLRECRKIHQIRIRGKKNRATSKSNHLLRSDVSHEKTRNDIQEKSTCKTLLEDQTDVYDEGHQISAGNLKTTEEAVEVSHAYKCDLCNFVNSKKCNLNSHIRRVHCERRFVCNICEKKFKLNHHLQRHLLTHKSSCLNEIHDTNSPSNCNSTDSRDEKCNPENKTKRSEVSVMENYECDICKESFSQQILLRGHLKIHERSMGPYKCDKCNYVNDNKRNLSSHKRRVHCKKNFTCEICEKAFKLKYHLTYHLKTHTVPKSKKYQKSCELCDFSTSKKLLLEKHHWNEHSIKSHQCEECSKTFVHRYLLREHFKIHDKTREYICNKCDFSSSFKTVLFAHKRVHAGEKYCKSKKRYQCKQCDYSTHIIRNLKFHQRSFHSEKFYDCNVCDYVAKTPEYLKQHYLVHKQHKRFSCDKCPYSTPYKRNLRIHKRTHTGERPFKCLECKYSATNASSLVVHKRVHSGEKPCKCLFCEYKTSSNSNLKIHWRRRHPEKPLHDIRIITCEKCSFSSKYKSSIKKHQYLHLNDKL